MDSRSKSRIIGVNLGEAKIDFVNPGAPPLTATFALIRDDGELCGRVDRRLEWSTKVLLALETLRLAMEEDIMGHLFEPQPPEASTEEPEQM